MKEQITLEIPARGHQMFQGKIVKIHYKHMIYK